MGKQEKVPFRQRLAFQLGVPFSIFTFFVFCILIAGSLLSLQYDQAQINAVPERLASTASNEISILFGNLQSTILVIAKSATSTSAVAPEQAVYIHNVLQENPAILEMAFFDAAGKLHNRFASPTVADVIEADPEAVAESEQIDLSGYRNQSILFTPIKSIYGTSIAHWVFPIRDTDGKEAGYLRVTIDLSGLWNTLSKYRENGIATLYIVTKTGKIIVANAQLQDSASDETHQTQIEERISKPPTVTSYTGVENVRVVGKWVSVPPTDWILVAEIPENAFAERTNRTIATIIVIFAGTIILFFYEVVAVRQALLRPLFVLRRAVIELAKGDYKTRVNVEADNEFQNLGGVLNQMAENIDTSTSAIVDRLRDLLDEQDRSSKLLVRRDLELVRANDKLRKLDDAKSEFVSVAAHQLRTPLSAVKWAVHMLLGGDLGGLAEPQKEVLLKAAQSNDRMIKLVNDLLNVDHIESGKSEYVYVPLMVTDLISSVLTELKPIAEQHGVTLQFDQGNRHFAPVSGDRDKLRGVFQNLIDNAIKYTSQGGAVRIGINEDDSHIKVSIADTGIGIPAIDQQKVFSKFFRSKNAVKVATDGTGLGLFIVREIVTQHKGKIWFDSIEGTGTTFNVVIPKLSPDSVRMAAYGTM